MQTYLKETSRRTLGDGRIVSVHAKTDSLSPSMVWIQIQVDGQAVATVAGPSELRAEDFKRDPRLKERGFTHNVHSSSQRQNFPLLAAEAQAFQIGADELRAEVLATDPEARLADLVEQRESLTRRVAGIRDMEADRKDRAWTRGDEMGAVVDADQFKADLDAATAALRDFDAAHPEALERILALRAETHERFLRAD